jgi:hypothetical protein
MDQARTDAPRRLCDDPSALSRSRPQIWSALAICSMYYDIGSNFVEHASDSRLIADIERHERDRSDRPLYKAGCDDIPPALQRLAHQLRTKITGPTGDK